MLIKLFFFLLFTNKQNQQGYIGINRAKTEGVVLLNKRSSSRLFSEAARPASSLSPFSTFLNPSLCYYYYYLPWMIDTALFSATPSTSFCSNVHSPTFLQTQRARKGAHLCCCCFLSCCLCVDEQKVKKNCRPAHCMQRQ